jgi:hypothetical protein
VLNDFYVAPDTVFVGPNREEIDLLIRIGRLLLVGEAKCQFFPVEALDLYRSRERLREGSAQAVRKAEAVRNSLHELQSTTGLSDTHSVTVLPFVLSNHVLGSGYPIDGVPVVDLLYLSILLRQGFLRIGVVMDRNGEVDPGDTIRFYTDQADAERRLPQLLAEQPVVQVFEPLVQRRMRPLPIDAGGAEVFEEYYTVSLQDDPFDFEPHASR